MNADKISYVFYGETYSEVSVLLLHFWRGGARRYVKARFRFFPPRARAPIMLANAFAWTSAYSCHIATARLRRCVLSPHKFTHGRSSTRAGRMRRNRILVVSATIGTGVLVGVAGTASAVGETIPHTPAGHGSRDSDRSDSGNRAA